MSARHYRGCPQCELNAKAKREAAIAAAKASYGVVPAADYLAAILAAELIREPQETLEEYYDIGVWDGKFQMRYSAGCRTCGFQFENKCEAPIKLAEPSEE